MKKTIFLSFTVLVIILLAGCQQAEPATPETQDEAQEEQGKLIVEQVNPDGSKEQVMEINLEPDKPADVAVAPGIKGMAISEEGFLPAELTVTPGTKVFFQNTDSEPHWPISADETNELCAGFGPEEQIEPGDTWEYDFSEEGECPIQDQLNPELTAHVSVVAEE